MKIETSQGHRMPHLKLNKVSLLLSPTARQGFSSLVALEGKIFHTKKKVA